jgi:hypothetical protein
MRVLMLTIVVEFVGNNLLFLPSLAMQAKHLHLSSLFLADLLKNLNGREQVYFMVVDIPTGIHSITAIRPPLNHGLHQRLWMYLHRINLFSLRLHDSEL